MPVVASPTHQGWIKVAPPRRNPQISKAKQEAALRGPLAYFSCQPVPSKLPTKLPPCPKYDLDEDGHPHKHRGGGGGGGGGKNRTVSAPARHGRRGVHYDDEDEDDYNSGHEEQRHRRSPPSRERSRPPAHHTSHNHRSAPTAAQPRATSSYWTGSTKKHTPSPRSYTSSNTGSHSSRSTASARWANATAPLDLG